MSLTRCSEKYKSPHPKKTTDRRDPIAGMRNETNEGGFNETQLNRCWRVVGRVLVRASSPSTTGAQARSGAPKITNAERKLELSGRYSRLAFRPCREGYRVGADEVGSWRLLCATSGERQGSAGRARCDRANWVRHCEERLHVHVVRQSWKLRLRNGHAERKHLEFYGHSRRGGENDSRRTLFCRSCDQWQNH